MIPDDQSPRADRARQPRIAILVLGCLQTVYDRCIRTIRATWGARTPPDVDIYYVYGGQPSGRAPDGGTREPMVELEQVIGQPRPALADGEVWVSGDIILCGAADVRDDQPDCILRKRLLAFGYLARQKAYDFVHTVCASSYVDVAGLQRYVKTLPFTGVYHGALHVHGDSGYPFASGASFLLSRDIVDHLGDSAARIIASYREDLPDDVVIGHVVASRFGGASATEIAHRIGAGARATDNQTFVVPWGGGSRDFVTAPAYSQVPDDRSFHFHFHSRRMWELENFHRRFFST